LRADIGRRTRLDSAVLATYNPAALVGPQGTSRPKPVAARRGMESPGLVAMGCLGKHGCFGLLSHLAWNRWAARRHAVTRLRADVRLLSQRVWRLALLLAVALLPNIARAQVELPVPDQTAPIRITAESGAQWTEGVYEVWLLSGNCRIQQGTDMAGAREAVLWIERGGSVQHGRGKVIAYLEGDATIASQRQDRPASLTDREWLGRFTTDGEVRVEVGQAVAPPNPLPPIYQRAITRRNPVADGAIRRTQFTLFQPSPQTQPTGPVQRRIRLFARSNVPVQAQWEVDRTTNRAVAVVGGGVSLIIEGVPNVGVLDISADRLVLWTIGVPQPGQGNEMLQAGDIPLEVYIEGNIIFREDDRTVYAQRMYYDVSNHVGVILDAELLTPAPSYEGLVRLRAATLRQVGPDRFIGDDVFITTSRLGQPTYRLQSGQVYFEDRKESVVNPVTGETEIEHQRLALGRNNAVFVDDVPVLYWPYFSSNLENPTFYLRSIRFRNDKIFGTQVLTNLDGYQLLGIQHPPEGTDFSFSLDYLSKRGLGHGGTFVYDRDDFLGVPGPTVGLIDFWGILDQGTDNLGGTRRSLEPPVDYRYRLFAQHRQWLANDFRLTAEVGWISDRNFLQQYFEKEWNELKDESTGLELKQSRDDWSWSVSADVRLNDFFTETEYLPRADHFLIGQPLVNDAFTWFEHSSAGYARFRTARPPTSPQDTPFNYLPWEVGPNGQPLSVEGERLFTRQEIDWPFQLGPVKVVPFALGELADWGADRTGDSLQRAYGEVGVRASLPMWRVYPWVESDLFNVHGIAHKIFFDAQVSVSEANRNLDQLPLYDPVDDNAIEAFRRRFIGLTFGGVLPAQFDERFYAVRAGLGDWVASPSPEIADDLVAVRLGARQRWQTKRGPPGAQHVIDWITLDTELTLFPKTEQNFGGPGELRLPLARGRPLHAAVGRHIRLLQQRRGDRQPGGGDYPAAARQPVPGRARLRRPDPLHGAHHLAQLPDEPQVDRHLCGVDRPHQQRQHRPEPVGHADRRVVPCQHRFHLQRSPKQLRLPFLAGAAIPAQGPVGQCRRGEDSPGRSLRVGLNPRGPAEVGWVERSEPHRAVAVRKGLGYRRPNDECPMTKEARMSKHG
jgi:hypothetical protein